MILEAESYYLDRVDVGDLEGDLTITQNGRSVSIVGNWAVLEILSFEQSDVKAHRVTRKAHYRNGTLGSRRRNTFPWVCAIRTIMSAESQSARSFETGCTIIWTKYSTLDKVRILRIILQEYRSIRILILTLIYRIVVKDVDSFSVPLSLDLVFVLFRRYF